MTSGPEKTGLPCTVCPRRCSGASRLCGEIPLGPKAALRLSCAGIHFGEEPPVTGKGGSGTIFVTGCNLRCSFCQNYQISRDSLGRAVDQEEFIRICRRLREEGAENLNIVTGTHQTPILASYLRAYKKTEAGAALPVCWNSSAYELTETLGLLRGLVDLWLPDLKTLSRGLAASLFAAPDYGEIAKKTVAWMCSQGPVIVRHLFLPGYLEETAAVLDWLSRNARAQTVSLMTQYIPMTGNKLQRNTPAAAFARDAFPAPGRRTSAEEYDDLQDFIAAYNFENLFYQELTADNSWLPDFTQKSPFPSPLFRPVWHWMDEKTFAAE